MSIALGCGPSSYLGCLDLVLQHLCLWFACVFGDTNLMTTHTGPAAVLPAHSKESEFSLKGELKGWPVFSLAPIGRRNLFSKPASGVKAEKGRRAKMEDTYRIQENFLDISCDLGSVSSLFPNGMDNEDAHLLSMQDPVTPHSLNGNGLVREVLHYYAVYDGHGGLEASEYCAAKMHENVKESWNNIPCHSREWSSESLSCNDQAFADEEDHVRSEDIAEMFQRAFKVTDDDFESGHENSAITGSTAVVALVGETSIYIGYCGDSRAVLCRKQTAYPLTVDHKPERDDETDRIQKAGGQVLFFNGPRVMGLLAMSRAIGDQSLRPYVISQPDCCIVHRSPDDEILILASDGLWDVLSNQEACTLALKCLKRAKEKGATPEDATRLTATVLTRAAMDRGSRDNITVLVVDLRTQRLISPVPSEENDSPSNSELCPPPKRV